MIGTDGQKKIILFTILTIAFVWTSDAAFDAFVLREGSFSSLLLNVMSHEPFLRSILTLSFIIFGIIIARIAAKNSRALKTLGKQSAAIEASLDGIAIYSRDLEYVYVNQAYASINGYENPGEIIGKKCGLTYDDNQMKRMMEVVEPALAKGGLWRGELLARRKNGSMYYQEASATRLEDGGRVCVIRDITWRKRSEERLRRSERFLNMIFDSIRDPFCIFDRDFQIIRVNEAYAHLKNVRQDDLIGRKCHQVLAQNERVCDGCIVGISFHSGDPCAKEKQIKLPDGTPAWVEIFTYPILDEDGSVSHVMEYTRDVTERRKAEDEKKRLIDSLEYLSRTDSLTGLLNRRALTDSLTYEIDRAKRYGSDLSILLCDVDNFKGINDTWGHDMGDRALQTISATLKSLLRKADIAGRHGGDEFLLILPETTEQGAEDLAEKLRTIVQETVLLPPGEARVRVTISVGVASLDLIRDSLDSFVKRADDAMYVSKQAGRNRTSLAKALS